MRFEATFKTTDHSFAADFGAVQTASDGGYERGYAKGYEDGHADGGAEYAEQIVAKDDMIKGIIEQTLTHLTADMLSGVSTIGTHAFQAMNSLKTVYIPDNVRSIANNAFYSCAGLVAVTIGNGVSMIGGSAFSASSVNYVTIGSGIRHIDYTAFYNCRSLLNVLVEGDLNYIGEQAFQNCTSAQEFDFSHCTAVPKLNRSNAFSGTPTTCVIKVPAALLEDWKAATNWSVWADRIIGV